MGYDPIDTYVPGARGGAQVPQLVGQRVEAARAYAASAAWTVHVNDVPPATKDQPEGFVLRQVPAAGSVAPAGSVLLVDVARTRSFGEQYGKPLLGGVAAALAVVAVVFAVLWSSARSDAGVTDDGALDAADARIAELEAQVADLAAGGDQGAVIVDLQAQLDDTTARLATAEAQVADLTAQAEQAGADGQALAAERDALVVERDQLVQQVAELEAELGGITEAVVAAPDWIGQQQVAVEEFVRQQSMELVIQTVDGAETEGGDPVAAGTVVVQLPEAGTPLVEGSVVVITVVAPEA
jgi:PASTA domain